MTTDCAHCFCEACIVEALCTSEKRACPCCRRRVRKVVAVSGSLLRVKHLGVVYHLDCTEASDLCALVARAFSLTTAPRLVCGGNVVSDESDLRAAQQDGKLVQLVSQRGGTTIAADESAMRRIAFVVSVRGALAAVVASLSQCLRKTRLHGVPALRLFFLTLTRQDLCVAPGRHRGALSPHDNPQAEALREAGVRCGVRDGADDSSDEASEAED